MVWKPRTTVAVICERANQFLMVEETVHGEIRFNQPAGHLEDNESLVDAAVRECMEETSHHFFPEGLVGIYRWKNQATMDTFLRFTFFGACEHVPDRTLDDEIVAAHWLTMSAIKQRASQLRSPLVLKSLQDYNAGKRYPLEILGNVG